MPAGPIGPNWASGSWPDTAWEAGSWGAVAAPEQPSTPDLTRFPFVRRFASGGSIAIVKTFAAGAGLKVGRGASESLVLTYADGEGRKVSARAGSTAFLEVVPHSLARKRSSGGAEAVGAITDAEAGPGEAVDIETLCELLTEATMDAAGAFGLTRLS